MNTCESQYPKCNKSRNNSWTLSKVQTWPSSKPRTKFVNSLLFSTSSLCYLFQRTWEENVPTLAWQFIVPLPQTNDWLFCVLVSPSSAYSFSYDLGKRDNLLTLQLRVRTSSSTAEEKTICGFWNKRWKFSKWNYFKYYFMLFCLKVLSEKTFHKKPKVFFILNIWKTLKTDMFSRGSNFTIVICHFFVWIFRLTNTRVSIYLRTCNCCSFFLKITC